MTTDDYTKFAGMFIFASHNKFEYLLNPKTNKNENY